MVPVHLPLRCVSFHQLGFRACRSIRFALYNISKTKSSPQWEVLFCPFNVNNGCMEPDRVIDSSQFNITSVTEKTSNCVSPVTMIYTRFLHLCIADST